MILMRATLRARARLARFHLEAGFFLPDMLVFPTMLEKAVTELRGFREISLCAYWPS
jgi:hypothetical protein